MATLSAVWIPNVDIAIGSSLMGPGGDSGVIYLGKNRLFRIWSDNTSGLSITFGLGTAPTPTSSSYSIGPVPQDWDTGPNLDSIRLMNNSNISSAHYFIQVMAKF
jgi:hypothetical protein